MGDAVVGDINSNSDIGGSRGGGGGSGWVEKRSGCKGKGVS